MLRDLPRLKAMTMAQTGMLRPITSKDQEFLYRVYASTREEELAQTGWDAAQKEVFLRMQFNAQHTYYMDQFSSADFTIIHQNDEPIGRLYVDLREDEIRVIDIALLPEHRNRGVGSRLMKEILGEGDRLALPVRIHVEHLNPALHFYRRLGFHKIGDTGVYYLMEWSPRLQGTTSKEF